LSFRLSALGFRLFALRSILGSGRDGLIHFGETFHLCGSLRDVRGCNLRLRASALWRLLRWELVWKRPRLHARDGFVKRCASGVTRTIPVDQLAEYARKIGLLGVDLLQPDEYEIPRRYGLVCTMGYAGGGDIGKALNRVENHAVIEQGFRLNIPRRRKRVFRM